MNLREPTQRDVAADTSEELWAYTDRLNQLFENHKASLDDESREALNRRCIANPEVYAIYLEAWMRVGAQYFHDAPVFTMKDLEQSTDLRQPSAPLELLTEIFYKTGALDLDRDDTPDFSKISGAAFGASLYGKIDERLLESLQEDGPDTSKMLSTTAKEVAIEKVKAYEQAAGTGRSLDEVISSLMRIYLYTMLSGKKALHYRVADSIETAWSKPIEKYITDERAELLQKLVNLAVQPVQTDESTQAMRDIIEQVSPLKNTAKTWIIIAYFSESLRSQAKQDVLADMSQRTRALLRDVSQNLLYTPEEEARTSEIFCEEAGIDYSTLKVHAEAVTGEGQADSYNLHPMELDWEILPPGETELEKGARQIVEDVTARTGKTPEIDLDRLNILEGVRELWGKDKSYYSRGVRKKRSVVHDMNGQEQPDEYVILVLQETDAKTGLVREHAVAESPIAGPNALYVYRSDTTEQQYDWRTVMSLSKAESRKLGARSIKHRAAQESAPLNDVMIEKVTHLLTVPPTDFKSLEFSGVDKDGNVRVRRALGHSADRLTQK